MDNYLNDQTQLTNIEKELLEIASGSEYTCIKQYNYSWFEYMLYRVETQKRADKSEFETMTTQLVVTSNGAMKYIYTNGWGCFKDRVETKKFTEDDKNIIKKAQTKLIVYKMEHEQISVNKYDYLQLIKQVEIINSLLKIKE